MRFIKIFVLVILLLSSNQVFAQGNLAQSGANFLQIAVEPRGAALGGAVAASAGGAAALFWNPAGATQTENFDILLSHTDWFLDTRLSYGAIVKNFNNLGVIGLSVSSFYMDEMEITTVYASEGTNDYYNAGDISLGLSYARELTNSFSFGVTIKYVQEYIWNETASQVALDLGSVYRTSFNNLRIGMAIRNVSGTLNFKGDDIDDRIKDEEDQNVENNPRIERLNSNFRLPQVFQMGIAIDPLVMDMGTLSLFSDVTVPSDNDERIAFGTEFSFNDLAFLRGSYLFNHDTGSFSLGAGFHPNIIGMKTRIDYSYSMHTAFGDVHRFGFGLSF